jgi:hypothetical protein
VPSRASTSNIEKMAKKIHKFTENVVKNVHFCRFFAYEKISPITEMSISYLLEWLGCRIFEMMRNLNHEKD